MGLLDLFGGGSSQNNDRGNPQGGNPRDQGDLPTTRGDIGRLREDIANRQRNLAMMKSIISIGAMIIGGALLVLGGPVLGAMAPLIGGAVMLGGPFITTMLTRAEEEKLRIDGEYLDSLMQGGNWGRGNWRAYREEVAEQGYGFGQGQVPPTAFTGPQPPQHGRGRHGGPGPQGRLQPGY
jgi:hypothetical protein